MVLDGGLTLIKNRQITSDLHSDYSIRTLALSSWFLIAWFLFEANHLSPMASSLIQLTSLQFGCRKLLCRFFFFVTVHADTIWNNWQEFSLYWQIWCSWVGLDGLLPYRWLTFGITYWGLAIKMRYKVKDVNAAISKWLRFDIHHSYVDLIFCL